MTQAFKIEQQLVASDFYLFLTVKESVVDFDSFVDYLDNETTTTRRDNKTFREHFSECREKIEEYFEMMKSSNIVFAEYADEVLIVAPDYNRDSSTSYEVEVDVFTDDESRLMQKKLINAEDDIEREQIVDLEVNQIIERVKFFAEFRNIHYVPVVDSIYFYCIK